MDPLRQYDKRHGNQPILVCGLGPSLHGFERPEGVPTIGVNDIARVFTPDYVVILDKPEKFQKGHHREKPFETIMETQAKLFISHGCYHLWKPLRPDAVEMDMQGVHKHNAFPEWWQQRPEMPRIHVYAGSVFAAASLAGFMGGDPIGIIGMDLNDHPRLNPAMVTDWDEHGFARLRDFLARKGQRLVNLNPRSAIRSLPFQERLDRTPSVSA